LSAACDHGIFYQSRKIFLRCVITWSNNLHCRNGHIVWH